MLDTAHGRGGTPAERILLGFSGILQVDGYEAYHTPLFSAEVTDEEFAHAAASYDHANDKKDFIT
jgi:hypothetical protein